MKTIAVCLLVLMFAVQDPPQQFKSGVELVLDCPPGLVLRSNRDLLEHALLNLTGNAARHTERGQVRVSVGFDEGGSVIIEIGDTGSGIPADQLSRLFDRFYRGPHEGGSPGFGLGLPIAKDAVEAIGAQPTHGQRGH
mgnify:CR=1 FL=1